jgi:putative PEP-CTERM system TPR-repeat lipoprotein
MKKYVLVAVALLVVAMGAGAAWWKYGRAHDPMTNARAFLAKGDTRAAAIELRNAVRTDPTNAEAHLRLGLLQLQSGDPVAAEKELKQARDNGSKAPEIPVMLAQSYLQQGRNKELLDEFLPPAATPELSSQLLILRSYAQLATNNPAGAQASLSAAQRETPDSPNPPLAAARIAVGRGNLLLGEQQVTLALQHDPRRPDALLLKGQILNARGERAAALDLLNDALAIAPNYAAAQLERANLLITLDQDAKAKPDVDAVLKAQPNAAGGIYLLAVLQARAHDDANADANFQKLSGVMQRFPRAFYFQGIVKFDLGQMEQATDSASRYVQRNPGDPAGVKLLARILIATGHGDQALATLSGAVKSGTADAETLDLLAHAYVAAGKPAQAIESMGQAAAMAPQNAEILTHMASLKSGTLGQDQTRSDIARSLQISPQTGNPAEARVVAALSNGDVDEAAKALDALRVQSGNTETVDLLGASLLLMKQDLDGARTQYEALIRANPAQIRARVGLAQVLLLQNRPDDAERALTTVLDRDPGNAAALGPLVQVLLQTNRIARAVAVTEAAYTAAPTNIAFMLTLSDLYIRAGTPDKSLTLLGQAPKSASQTAAALAARARAELALQQPQAARASYQEVLKLAPGDTGVIRQVVALELADKDWEGARVTVHEALASRPADPELLRLLVGVDLTASGEPAAFATIAKLQADPATSSGATTLAADLYLVNNHYAEAAEAYAALLKKTPSTALLLSTVNADILAGLLQPANALLTDWVASHPDDLEAARTLGGMDISARRLDQAAPLLERVLAKIPDDPTSLNNLAWIYQQQHDPRALAMARRAFLLLPSPQSADTLGWTLTSQGHADEAMSLLRSAAASLPRDLAVQFHYAATLKATGKNDQAVEILGRLATAPSFDEQPQARQMLGELQAAK